MLRFKLGRPGSARVLVRQKDEGAVTGDELDDDEDVVWTAEVDPGSVLLLLFTQSWSILPDQHPDWPGRVIFGISMDSDEGKGLYLARLIET